MTQRKLEYFAKSENEFSTPLMDVSELNAKLFLGQQTLSIKISSIPEPFSDVSRNLLSYFVTSDDDTNPYLLLSPTEYSRDYVDIAAKLSKDVVADSQEPQLVNLKTNGLNRHPYFRINLPANDELDSITIAEAIIDKDFKSISGRWKKIIDDSNIPQKERWLSEISVYYLKDSNGSLMVSHFLPTNLREFYE